jgi:hypothetical protein
MELVDRYLQAVQFWLPANLKRDIVAELSEDLHAQIEERESTLGRNLNTTEIEDLLKQRGAPIIVANQFLPQRYLIGPLLFPVYLLVLRIALFAYMIPWVLTFIGLVVFSSAYHNGWVAHSWLQNASSLWGSLWNSAFITIGIVTAIFAVLERLQPKTHFLETFEPKSLPPVRKTAVIPRLNSSFEVGVQVVVAVWIAFSLTSPVVYDSPNLRITLAPHWYLFFLGWLLVVIVSGAISATNLIYPYWTRRKVLLRFFFECFGSIAFCWMLSTNILAQLTITNVSPERSAWLVSQINYWAARTVPFSLTILIVIAILNAYLNLRVRSRTEYPHCIPTPTL